MLAILIGTTLALYHNHSESVAAPVDAIPRKGAGVTPEAPRADFDVLLAHLMARAKEMIRKHRTFKYIVAALNSEGGPESAVAADILPAESATALKTRIEHGAFSVYGYARPQRAPGATDPDSVFFEIHYGNHRIKRCEMFFARTAAGHYDFYAPEPRSTAPGGAHFLLVAPTFHTPAGAQPDAPQK